MQPREFARASVYQFLKGAQAFAGLHKAFQLFCRRRACVEQELATRRAA